MLNHFRTIPTGMLGLTAGVLCALTLGTENAHGQVVQINSAAELPSGIAKIESFLGVPGAGSISGDGKSYTLSFGSQIISITSSGGIESFQTEDLRIGENSANDTKINFAQPISIFAIDTKGLNNSFTFEALDGTTSLGSITIPKPATLDPVFVGLSTPTDVVFDNVAVKNLADGEGLDDAWAITSLSFRTTPRPAPEPSVTSFFDSPSFVTEQVGNLPNLGNSLNTPAAIRSNGIHSRLIPAWTPGLYQ